MNPTSIQNASANETDFEDNENIYCCAKDYEVNRRLVTEIFKSMGNRNLAAMVNCLEQRHQTKGTEASWFIRPTSATLGCINEGKGRWDKNYQPSLMEVAMIRDNETFSRLFAKVGLKYASKTQYLAAEQKFGQITEECPDGKYLYVCYQNRKSHNSVFVRNDPMVNRLASDMWRKAGLKVPVSNAMKQ